MSARSRRSTQGERAAKQYASWVKAGHPRQVDPALAYRLTGLRYEEPVNLSTLAKEATR